MADNSCVQVALRVRPLIPSEVARGCKNAIDIHKDIKQVRISEKGFTFNHVFGSETSQEEFYKQSVESLVPNLFKGYNVTILAYGQTGSGKTHSMGTAYTGEGEMGIIPRAVQDIFQSIQDNFTHDINVTVSFVELYQEVLYDLLSKKPREKCVMEIREDVAKGIFIPGLTELPVDSAQDVLECLQHGAKGRATSSTNMNAQSSRSHAIFTLNISMTVKGGTECKTAKFNLVDLAGSERPKKTGATGTTFKEGVNINKGLFVLGNVISALGDEKGAAGYVNYRESNLTRLLKDSLGGNSITMMVACISAADYNIEETLSTLRYADRAKRIKNKPVVNEDPNAGEISKLQKIIQQLRLELSAHGGGTVISQSELDSVRMENSSLKSKLQVVVSQNLVLNEHVLLMQNVNEGISAKVQNLHSEYSTTMQNLNKSIGVNDVDAIRNQLSELKSIESQFVNFDNESKVTETELKKYECSSIVSDNENVEEEIGEQQDTHMNNQLALHAKIEHVNHVLVQKENLAKQLASNMLNMVDLAEMANNQDKIAELEKEKTELLQQLKQAQSNAPSSKMAEQRRKRVQELETQLRDLNRKVNEQARLIKLKEKDDLKIKKLNIEIASMKSEKVKLVRTMRQDSDRFRKWKVERERELGKLQTQDRKRLNQMASMKQKHNLQENVWKRKLEEAAASAKRFKDALALRKNVQDSRVKGKIERLGPWVQQELTIQANLVVAQATINTLLEDRSTLQEQVDKLKESEDDNLQEIHKLEEQIEMRSAQLQDLNQKLIDTNDADKNKNRFDNVQTMAEAKYVLQAMFDMTGEFKKAEIEVEQKNHHLESLVKQLESKLGNFEKQHALEISKIERDYVEKTELLLKQLRGVNVTGIDEQIQHRLKSQEEVIDTLSNELEAMRNEHKALQEEIEKTPLKKKKRSDSSLDNKENSNVAYTEINETLEVSFDDDEKDPDWRKTPLGKQVRALRDTTIIKQALKRNYSGGCGCRGDCKFRRCSCRKVNKTCSDLCQCKADNCCNRDESDEILKDEEYTLQLPPLKTENNFFKKPSYNFGQDFTNMKNCMHIKKLVA